MDLECFENWFSNKAKDKKGKNKGYQKSEQRIETIFTIDRFKVRITVIQKISQNLLRMKIAEITVIQEIRIENKPGYFILTDPHSVVDIGFGGSRRSLTD